MIQIYHNPRCSKSRLGVQLLEEKGVNFEIVKYLNEIPTKKELKEILVKLRMTPRELLRTGEKIWKENFKGKELSDDQIIDAMIANPKLIERPIVINENKAVVARPTEKILDIL